MDKKISEYMREIGTKGVNSRWKNKTKKEREEYMKGIRSHKKKLSTGGLLRTITDSDSI